MIRRLLSNYELIVTINREFSDFLSQNRLKFAKFTTTLEFVIIRQFETVIPI